MSNTTPTDGRNHATAFALAAATGVAVACFTAAAAPTATNEDPKTMTQLLTQKQQCIAPIGAATAMGDLPRLSAALNDGLDAGLTVSDVKEILVQLYAYAGFPRSLNALSELMKVVESRKQRGVEDAPGRDPGPVPSGK